MSMTVYAPNTEPSDLQSRPALIGEGTVPRMDENMDVFVSICGYMVSAPLHATALEEAIRRALGDLSIDNEYGMAAVPLPECDRVVLIISMSGIFPNASLMLIPHIGMSSMLRVLHHAFDGQIAVFDGSLARSAEAMREGDANVYGYMKWLIGRFHALVAQVEEITITDRRELSQYVLSTFRTVEWLIGLDIPMSHQSPFPVAYDFCGTVETSTALWLQMLLILGLRRGFSVKAWENARLTVDDELLLPTIEISAGNRTPLPYEWEECHRVAKTTGMFFDVKRKRDRIRVRFCPVTPHILPSEFYSVKTMAPIIEGIRKMKLR